MCNNVSDIPIIGPLLSKPGRMLPMLGSGVASAMGAGPMLSNMIGTGIGAGQGGTTGLWGEPGGSSMLKGGATGFAMSPVGRGVQTGLSSQMNRWQNPGAMSPSGNQPAFANFGQGFMQGAGEAIPFKNQLNSMMGRQFFGTDVGANTMSLPQISSGNRMLGGGNQIPQGPGSMGGGSGGGGGFNLNKFIPSALSMLGAQGAGAVDVPNYGQLSQDMQRQIQGDPSLYGPVTEPGKAAAAKLLEYVNDPTKVAGPAVDEYMAAIDQNNQWAREIATQDVDARHTNYGTYGGSDWQRDRNQAIAYATNNANLQKGQIQQQVFQNQLSTHISSMSQAFNMDQASIEQIAGLTNMSIYEIAMKYGLKAQEVKDFRDALYSLAASAWPGTQDYGSSQQLLQNVIG